MPGSPATSTTAPGRCRRRGRGRTRGPRWGVRPPARVDLADRHGGPFDGARRRRAHGDGADLRHASPGLALAAAADPLRGLPPALRAPVRRRRCRGAARGGGGQPTVCARTDTARTASRSRRVVCSEWLPQRPPEHATRDDPESATRPRTVWSGPVGPRRARRVTRVSRRRRRARRSPAPRGGGGRGRSACPSS